MKQLIYLSLFTLIGGVLSYTTSIPVHAAEIGLVRHLTFDEGSGTTAGDASGSGNGATVTNPAVWDVSGKQGSAITLDGSAYASGGRLELGDFTLSTWVRTTSTARGDLFLQYDDAPYHGFGLILNPGFDSLGCGSGNLIGLWVGAATYICTPSAVANLNDGQWHLVSATWDNSAKMGRIYVDGNMLAEETRTDADTSSIIPTMYVGYNPYGELGYIGSLDDMRVYSRVLSASEIHDLFLPPTPPPPPNTPPTISLIGASTVNLTVGDIFTDEGVTIFDAEDATSTLVVSSSTDPLSGVNILVVGTYVITYTVTDTASAQASTTRTVIVTAPVEPPPPPPATTTPPTPPAPEQPAPQAPISTSHGSSGSYVGLGAFGAGGRVLGATAPCGKYLTHEMRPLENNDPEDVTKLQALINETTGANLPLTGVFGPRTLGAFKEFQLKYRATIIDPWVENGSITNARATGLVGETSLWTINTMVCPSLQLPKPTLN